MMRLVLFFTRGVSLKTWAEKGLLTREIALYQQLMMRGAQVSFITYGRADDLDFRPQLGGIEVLCNRKGRSPERYAAWLPYLFAPTLARASVIKTNQMEGGEVALRAARLFHKPLLARCGYMASDFARREGGESAYQAVRQSEDRIFSAAQRIIVTTPMMAQDIQQRLPQTTGRVHVVPNYVDTDLFAPQNRPKTLDVLFIGRLQAQKNVVALLEALAPLPYTLGIIGTGEQEAALKAEYGDLGGRVRWLGNLPHSDLPAHINGARLFVLPSLYEGHPKTLIEAMACGATVLGTEVDGIREVLQHGETGWLCPPTAEGLREALVHLMEDEALRERLGAGARVYALANYSLTRIATLEWEILMNLAGKQ